MISPLQRYLGDSIIDIDLYMGDTKPSKEEWKFLHRWIKTLTRCQESLEKVTVLDKEYEVIVTLVYMVDDPYWFVTLKDDSFNSFAKSRKKALRRFKEGFAVYLDEDRRRNHSCKTCHSDTQVWNNQITGKVTCHRWGCQ